MSESQLLRTEDIRRTKNMRRIKRIRNQFTEMDILKKQINQIFRQPESQDSEAPEDASEEDASEEDASEEGVSEIEALLSTLDLMAGALTRSMSDILLSTSTLMLLDIEENSPLDQELTSLIKHTWHMNELIDGINKLTRYAPKLRNKSTNSQPAEISPLTIVTPAPKNENSEPSTDT